MSAAVVLPKDPLASLDKIQNLCRKPIPADDDAKLQLAKELEDAAEDCQAASVVCYYRQGQVLFALSDKSRQSSKERCRAFYEFCKEFPGAIAVKDIWNTFTTCGDRKLFRRLVAALPPSSPVYKVWMTRPSGWLLFKGDS
jgi:hypothetical protein